MLELCFHVLDAAEVVLNKCVTFQEDPNEEVDKQRRAEEKPIHLDYQFIEDELAPWKMKPSLRSISKQKIEL